MDETQELLEEFRSIARERTQRINLYWLEIEKGGEVSRTSKDLFRELHTLKGEARMMGLAEIASVAHAAEDFLLVAQKRSFEVPDSFGDLLLRAMDGVLALVAPNPTPVNIKEIHAGFERLKGDLENRPAKPPVIEDSVTESIDRKTLDLAALNRPTPSPPIHPPRSVSGSYTLPVTPRSASSIPMPPASSSGVSLPPTTTSSGTFPALSRPTSTPSSSPSFPVVGTGSADPGSNRPMPNPEELSLWGGATAATDAQTRPIEKSANREFGFVRVDSEDLSGVGESVDWLVAHQDLELKRLRQLRDVLREGGRRELPEELRSTLDAMVEAAEERAEHTLRLDHKLRRLRMVPVRDLFTRHVRTVRDLAHDQGKDVRTVIRDLGSRIDRQALERLHEPLLHLIRNSVDHGIELPAIREGRGKTKTGTITLGAEHMGSFVRITVEDDGGGVDLDKVRQEAIDRGYWEEAEAERKSAEDILGLLFVAGFTTRKATSEISGRGYGLDIVKWELERLGGSVGISSTKGLGTRIELRAPFSTSATRVVTFSVRAQIFALPVTAVLAVVDMKDAESSEALGRRSIRVLGEWVPIVSGGLAVFGEAGSTPESRVAIVVAYGEIKVAILVEEPPKHAEVVVKPLGDVLDSVRLVTGAGILGEGVLALILNPGELVARAHGAKVSVARSTQTKGPQKILLVEDSAITRRMVAQIVRGFGFKVTEAANGREGLEKAQGEIPDLILTDLDMPEMDGFTMISKLRKEPGFETLPIVVLSTRASEDDRKRASDVGADSYVTKTSFTEAKLRDILNRQLGDNP